MKKFLIILVVIIATIIGLLVAANFMSGKYIKKYIENNSKEFCNRKVSFDNIDINIFTGSIELEKCKIFELDEVENFLTIDTLTIKLQLINLLFKEIKLKELTIISPCINIIQNEDEFNFDDILAKFNETEDSTQNKEDSESTFTYNFNNINIKNGNIVYKDLKIKSKLDLKKIHLQIPQVYFDNKSTDLGLNLSFADGGEFDAKIAYSIDKENFDITMNLNNFTVIPLLPYFQEYFKIDDLEGKLNANLNIIGNSNHIFKSDIKGNVEIVQLNLLNEKKEKIITAENCIIDIEKINLLDNSYQFNQIQIDNFETNFIVFDSTKNNYTDFFVENTETETEDENEEEIQTYKLFIKKLKVAKSNILYTDYSIGNETFEYPINNINIDANNISFTNPFNLKFDAVIGNKGEIKVIWNGQLNNFDNQTINLYMKNIKLADFSPYFYYYTAYPITDGIMSVTSTNQIQYNIINSSNLIEILNCKLDKKDKSMKPEFNIPLKTGLYLLTDRNGKISIDLPITGNIKSPEFSYRKIIFKTLGNLMLKIVTSPIDIFKKKDTNADIFKEITLTLNANDFNIEHYSQLNKIAEAIKDNLNNRNDLIFKIEFGINKELCKTEIAVKKMKTEYYLNKIGKNTSELNSEDINNINSIKNSDKSLISYMTNLTGKTSNKINEIAINYYDNQMIEQELNNQITAHFKRLKDYFIIQGIEENKINKLEIKDMNEIRNTKIKISFNLGLLEEIEN